MLINALFDAGFLVTSEDGETLIHDWQSYAGKLIDRRKRNAEAMKKARADHQEQGETPSPPSQNSTCATRVRHVADECKPTGPYRTEEKRREDKKEEDKIRGGEAPPARTAKVSRVHVACKPPTLDEITAWLTGHNHPVHHALPFLSHYGANGWYQSGGKQVYSWPHALAGWVERDKTFAGGNRSAPPAAGFVSGTLANPEFVQEKFPPGYKHPTVEEAIRTEQEYNKAQRLLRGQAKTNAQ